ncbi:MAG: OmpA family protein [Rhodospirillales bacterium]|nr:OmpA family protein [Rhodospirillales bacterium]
MALVGLLAGGLGACSVPDAANPVEWYKSSRDWVVGKDESPETKAKKAESDAKSRAGANEPFPDVKTVPDRPVVTPEKQREMAARGLVGDRANARYADEAVRRDTGTGAPPPPRPLAEAPPVPAAPPQVPVASAPLAPSQPPTTVQPAQPGLRLVQPAQSGETADQVFRRRLAESGARTIAPELANQALAAGQPQSGQVVLRPPPGVTPIAAAQPMPAAQPALAVGGRSGLVAPRTGAAQPFATLNFDVGSTAIGAEGMALIRQAADAAKAGHRVVVVGHASSRTRDLDPTQHQMVNFEISAARADAVARELRRMGVTADRLVVAAKSDSEPLTSEEMPSQEAINRRAEIYLER